MKITVLQWNIWYKENVQNIASFLLTNKADIICLQELMYNFSDQEVEDVTKYLADELGYHYYTKSIKIEGESWQQANGIFSRFPIVQQRSVWINEPVGTTKGYDNEYRAYIETVLDVKGTLLTVATTHMSYTHLFESTERKQAETNRLIDLIKARKNNYILTGDFNALPDSYTVQQVAKYLENVGPSFEENTWTTKPFSNNGFATNELIWRIDYVFATKDIVVNTAEILPAVYSDHLPIFAEVSLQP